MREKKKNENRGKKLKIGEKIENPKLNGIEEKIESWGKIRKNEKLKTKEKLKTENKIKIEEKN